MTMRHLPAYTRILGLMTAALLLLPAAATAQPQKRFLTLEQCRSIALDSSAILRSARLTEEKTALDTGPQGGNHQLPAQILRLRPLPLDLQFI